MLITGTRASKIKSKPLKGNYECDYCNTQGSFTATTFSKYFHVFWIPFFPLFKSTIFECNHCKKSYSSDEVSERTKVALQKSNELDPPKRPIWQGCGCLLLIVLFVVPFSISLIYGVFSEEGFSKINNDLREESLSKDLRLVTAFPDKKTDSISYNLKECISTSIEGIDVNKIEYFSKIREHKLLILLKVRDMKKIEKSSRKELVFAVQDCLNDFNYNDSLAAYIGVDGRWNMLMVKTPKKSDLGGKYASKSLLLEFYGATILEKKDSLNLKK